MLRQLFSLENRVALVTGGDKGLGQGIALALAQAGAKVAISSRTGSPEQTLKHIHDLGGQALAFQADQSDPQNAEPLIEQVLDGFGRIDILVNNAGTIRRANAAETEIDDFRDVLDINVTGIWALSQAAGRRMIEQKRGKIINIASLLSFQGGVRVPAYTASKHAIAGLTKALANEWAAHGLNINAIAPGYMLTDNTAPIRADAQRSQQILDRIPAQRWGEPSDLAGAVIFLASSASDYVNGHILAVDGGWLAR